MPDSLSDRLKRDLDEEIAAQDNRLIILIAGCPAGVHSSESLAKMIAALRNTPPKAETPAEIKRQGGRRQQRKAKR